MILAWTEEAWNDYVSWQDQDRKTLRRINKLLADIVRHPFEGIGKPEPLKWDFHGTWSRRIDATNRLIYTVVDDTVSVLSARDHY